MSIKDRVAELGGQLGLFGTGYWLQKQLYGGKFVRVVNYHNTPAAAAAQFERHLELYAASFAAVSRSELDACMAGHWASRRPGIFLTFDDGFRSNFDIAAPLLEKHGYRGVFFISTDFLGDDRADCDRRFQRQDPPQPEPYMSWPECADLIARGHVVGSHTRTHARLSDSLAPGPLTDEIAGSREILRARLKADISDFCWVGGEEWSYGSLAYGEILRAGYQRAFMTNLYPVVAGSAPHWIQRTNIEADWPLNRVRFYLSGAMDLVYWQKRRRLAAKLLHAAKA